MASDTLPPITSLATASEETIKSTLNTLFEPSPALHVLALPAIQQRTPANPGLSSDLPPAYTSSTIAKPTVPAPPFPSYAGLIAHVGRLLHQLASCSTPGSPEREQLHAILGSHPRLGAKKVDSAQSRAEQAQLNAGGGVGEAERLRELNEEYEAKFPGLRYVVFVNGRSRDVVMVDMRRRIDRGDVREEEREAIQAMVDIAIDRAGKLGAAE
ncbi:Oxo-4-hydroxy-4-carboxy-5-ureidoimidazoline decarboxylase [Xylariaceae sp. FL0016]|nr:Oxo-4-hydroxy-4-carboxy-5-ureidoimidazoline decarboxylase [Xylariaceae sp. FL0016]